MNIVIPTIMKEPRTQCSTTKGKFTTVDLHIAHTMITLNRENKIHILMNTGSMMHPPFIFKIKSPRRPLPGPRPPSPEAVPVRGRGFR